MAGTPIWADAVAGPEHTTLCLDVGATPTAETAALTALVQTEVARHAMYRVVSDGCETRLFVSLLRVGRDRQLTVRLGEHVPLREGVAEDDIADVLAELIALAFDHDPITLHRDPARMAALERASRDLRIHSAFHIGARVTQAAPTPRIHSNPAGLTLTFRRHTALLRAGGRVRALTTWPAGHSTEPLTGPQSDERLLTHVDVAGTLDVDMWANEAHSPFVGVGFGVDWQRFGRADTTQSTAQALGPFVELRSGWTFLRLTDVDIEVATSLQLPLHRRIDSGDEARRDWAPLLLFELGVAFGL